MRYQIIKIHLLLLLIIFSHQKNSVREWSVWEGRFGFWSGLFSQQFVAKFEYQLIVSWARMLLEVKDKDDNSWIERGCAGWLDPNFMRLLRCEKWRCLTPWALILDPMQDSSSLVNALVTAQHCYESLGLILVLQLIIPSGMAPGCLKMLRQCVIPIPILHGIGLGW